MQLFQNGFMVFWTPIVYEKHWKVSQEKASQEKEFYKKANMVVSVGMFSLGLLILGGKDLIFMLLSKSYREAAYVSPFLLLYPTMYTISETTVIGINFTKKTYWHIVITGVSGAANFFGNTLLVPHLCAKGAAISTGVSYMLFFAMRTIISEKLYKVGFELRRIYSATIILVCGTLLGTFVRSFVLNLVVAFVGIVAVMLIYKDYVPYVYKRISSFVKKNLICDDIESTTKCLNCV
ncbi:polysaccharide biosynthesis C-terminal domain-containing protein [Fervidobacterium riparium]|uniref:lipopolysaccharide biosynthesis protein n=1 Tax=Fervidobacterium gondwanense TaxID=44754 RepID=UPI003C720AA0